MRKSKKKKRYNLFQNLKFVFKHIHSWDKWALPVYIAKTPIDIVYQLGQTYFAPIIIALVESGKSVGIILAVTVAVSSILALSAKYNERFNAITMNKRQDISRRFDLMLGEKIMSMDYEILEGPYGKNKLQKAKNSLGNEGVYVFLDYLFKLITAIVGFTSFVVILSTLNPWIVVILFISFVLPLLADLVADKLVNGTKNKRAEIDRHLNYTDIIRGIKGSTTEHLTGLQYEIQQDTKRLKDIESKLQKTETQYEEVKTVHKMFSEIESMGKKTLTGKVTVSKEDYDDLSNMAKECVIVRSQVKTLEEENKRLSKRCWDLQSRINRLEAQLYELKQICAPYLEALKAMPEKVKAFIDDVLKTVRKDKPEQQVKFKNGRKYKNYER